MADKVQDCLIAGDYADWSIQARLKQLVRAEFLNLVRQDEQRRVNALGVVEEHPVPVLGSASDLRVLRDQPLGELGLRQRELDLSVKAVAKRLVAHGLSLLCGHGRVKR